MNLLSMNKRAKMFLGQCFESFEGDLMELIDENAQAYRQANIQT